MIHVKIFREIKDVEVETEIFYSLNNACSCVARNLIKPLVRRIEIIKK